MQRAVLFLPVLVCLGPSRSEARLRETLEAGLGAEDTARLSCDFVFGTSAGSASLSSLNSTWEGQQGIMGKYKMRRVRVCEYEDLFSDLKA